MIWIVIVSSIAVAATYVGIFLQTRDTWAAVLAASAVSAVAVIATLIRGTRPPVTRKVRLWALGIGTVVIIATATHMKVMYQQTHWQYNTLHLIHKVIEQGIATEILRTHGIETLSAFYGQSGSHRLTLGGVFLKRTRWASRDSLRIELGPDYRENLFAASVTDTEIVLICQPSIRIDGEDPNFKNHDGQIGAIQSRMRITRKGLFYESQN